MRLAKYLAHAGIASRRKAEKLIEAGLVQVNGRVVTEVDSNVEPERDTVAYKHNVISLERALYILFYKPTGCLSTVTDKFNRPAVTDFFPDLPVRIYPVGRLDMETTGILLLTNDGDFANRMLHPRYELRKYYQARLQGNISAAAVQQLEKGVILSDGLTAPARVKVLEHGTQESVIIISIHEGRKRQIRRMCSYVGYPVISLKRVGYGQLRLGNLQPGEYRYLTANEVGELLRLTQPVHPASLEKPFGQMSE